MGDGLGVLSSHTGAVLDSSRENLSSSPAFTTRRTVSSLSCLGSSSFLWKFPLNVSVGSRSLPSTVTVTVLSFSGL